MQAHRNRGASPLLSIGRIGHYTGEMAGQLVDIDELDQRILAALQVDGRATWRKLADVLEEPERSIARRGARLISERVVVIRGLASAAPLGYGTHYVLTGNSALGMGWAVAASLARRRQTIVSYALTGAKDVFADFVATEQELSTFLYNEQSVMSGLTQSNVYPVLRYFKLLEHWHHDLLSPDQVAALRSDREDEVSWPRPFDSSVQLTKDERILIELLVKDGRCTLEELSRRSGLSAQTVSRKTNQLRSRGLIRIRAVMDPRILELPFGAMLAISCAPKHIESIATALRDSPLVRYGSIVAGDKQIFADVRVQSPEALYRFISETEALRDAGHIDVSTTTGIVKQSGVLAPNLDAASSWRGFRLLGN